MHKVLLGRNFLILYEKVDRNEKLAFQQYVKGKSEESIYNDTSDINIWIAGTLSPSVIKCTFKERQVTGPEEVNNQVRYVYKDIYNIDTDGVGYMEVVKQTTDAYYDLKNKNHHILAEFMLVY